MEPPPPGPGPASSAALTTQRVTFTPRDIRLFQNVIRHYTKIIESKRRSVNRLQVQAAWLQVTEQFNETSSKKVTMTHLKQLWTNMKNRAMKNRGKSVVKIINKTRSEQRVHNKDTSEEVTTTLATFIVDNNLTKDRCSEEPDFTPPAASPNSLVTVECIFCCRSQALLQEEPGWESCDSWYQNMLSSCFNITIALPLGSKICNSCIARLRDAYNFKLLVLSSQKGFDVKLNIIEDTNIKSELGETSALLKKEKADSAHIHCDSADIKFYSADIKCYSADIKYDSANITCDSADIKCDSADSTCDPADISSDSADTHRDPEDINCVLTDSHEDSADISDSVDIHSDSGDDSIVSSDVFVSSNSNEPVTTQMIPKRRNIDSFENDPNQSKNTHNRSLSNDLSLGVRSSMSDKYIQGTEEVEAHIQNALTILTCSNATPFICKTSEGFKCYFCSQCFLDPELLRQHSRRDHTEGRKPKRNKSKAKSEFYINLDVKDLTCVLCSQQIENLDALTTHLIEVHKKIFKTEFGSKNIPFIMNNAIMNCQKCDRTFISFRALEAHMNSHFRHNICEKCGEGFVEKKRLKNHIKNRHSDQLYKCAYCDKKYTNTLSKRMHEDNVHKQSKRFKCSRCPERFYIYKDRQRHMTDIHGVAPVDHRCDICNKTFLSGSQLGLHRNEVHLLEKKYNCTYCFYKCANKGRFDLHMVTHVGEKKYKCDVCNKAYAYERSLVVHKWSHTNDSPHVCKVCGKRYTRNTNLRQHIKTQHATTQ